MNDDLFDFPCSSTFREGLPSLSVDYRASGTFTGPRYSKQRAPQTRGVSRRIEALELRVRELRKRCAVLEEENRELKEAKRRAMSTVMATTGGGLDVKPRA